MQPAGLPRDMPPRGPLMPSMSDANALISADDTVPSRRLVCNQDVTSARSGSASLQGSSGSASPPSTQPQETRSSTREEGIAALQPQLVAPSVRAVCAPPQSKKKIEPRCPESASHHFAERVGFEPTVAF